MSLKRLINLKTYISNRWDEVLQDEYGKEYMERLRYKLKDEYENYQVYPKPSDIFNSLKYVDYDDLRVVIIGQDPYHGPNQAHGFSFSVLPGNKIPPSLLNIYKELQAELGLYIPNNGYLIKWAKQGVLLLNRSLTVRSSEPNSHSNIGWERFTERIIQEINKIDRPIVFMLWGNNAKELSQHLDNPRHLILKSSHPSPFSANRGFFGCGHFARTNEFLRSKSLEEIDWQIENI